MSPLGNTKTFMIGENAAPTALSGSGRIEVRCPNCNLPTDVAVDTQLTDLTCSACGSHFSLVDQSQATRLAPSLTKIGRFELIERLGMGGFGSVWKARDKELDRTVAIKIPRQGGMTAEETEKFFREARAAAQLRHPNIVSVHEVGRDGDSVFIVSDFIRGVTLGDWLTGQRLTSREAAELCATIADALDHAHELGVVHRDLKPANIMIDGDGEPHLMDFGLARRDVGEVTMTMDGQVLGTPAYMSPEQAQGEGHTADRRSDVYSLGVVLFQLLTGELPFRGNARMLMHQVIHDEPPSPRKLNSNVAKDLETITLKCLEKTPDRRYPTTAAVAAELRRHLSGEPIQARPVSRPERALRWVARHKAVSALSVAVVLALLAGTAISTFFAVSARRFALDAVSQAKLAQSREQEAIEAKQEAEEARLEAERTLASMSNLAMAFSGVGNVDKSILLHEETLSARQQKLGPEHPATLASMLNLAQAYDVGGRRDESIEVFKQLLEARRKKFGPHHADTLSAIALLADALRRADRKEEAIPFDRELLTIRRSKLGAEHPTTLAIMDSLAGSYDRLNQLEEAIPLIEEVLTAKKKELGTKHTDVIGRMQWLAAVYERTGRRGDAIEVYKDVLTAQSETLGAEHPNLVNTMYSLSNAYRDAGRTKERIAILERMVSAQRARLGPSHEETLFALRALTELYVDADRTADAKTAYEELLSAMQATKGPEHPDTKLVTVQLHLVEGRDREAFDICVANGFYAETLRIAAQTDFVVLDELITESVELPVERAHEPIHALVLGELRLVAGDAKSAEAAMRLSIEKGGTWNFTYKSLGWCLLAQGRSSEARAAFEEALKELPRNNGVVDLNDADPDHLAAAYFLDVVTEQEFAQRLAGNQQFASFPAFYIGQRKEIGGDRDAAIKEYRKSAEVGKADTGPFTGALSRWRLAKLGEPYEP